jgi:hypothetical protein
MCQCWGESWLGLLPEAVFVFSFLHLVSATAPASLFDAPFSLPLPLCVVLELVLGRFPSDPSILVTFTRQALEAATAAAAAAGAEPAANNNNDSNTNSSASYARALEQLVLQVLQGHEGSCAAVKADGGLAGQLHALLYNQGVAQFEDRCFEAASRLFTASLEFAEVWVWVCRWCS